jgi:hypothetical protein
MKNLRKIIRESIKEVVEESMNMVVTDHGYEDDLDNILDISHYIIKKVAYDLWPKLGLTPEQEETIGGYVLDHTSNTSTNMGGSLASDFSSGTQLIPKYSPASTTAVIIQSLGTILSPTTNFVGDGHIYATLYSDTLTLYIDGVSKGTTSSPPDGLSDMEDCIGTIEVEGVPADYSAEYKLSVYYRTVGNIDQAKLNTFIGMLMS